MINRSPSLILVAILSISNVYADTNLCIELNNMPYWDIREYIHRTSVENYLRTIGPCPCPYNIDVAYGQYCGDRSAYTKSFVKFPKCYPEDVTGVDIANLKASACKDQEKQNDQTIQNNINNNKNEETPKN